MKDEECANLNKLDNNLLDDLKSEVKNHKIKYIIIITCTFIFFISFLTLLIIVINHSKQINDFKNQSIDLKKENAKQFELLNNKINDTEIQLLKKESEINDLKLIIDNLTNEIKILNKNFKQKDEEIFKQNTLNFNILNDDIINLKNELKLNEEEYLRQNLTNYILLNNTIDIIETKLQQKEKEIIEQNIINYNILNESIYNIEKELRFNDEKNIKENNNNFNLLNNNINQVETKINILEYNLSLLIKFNIKILADFYFGKNQAKLCSENAKNQDRIDDSRIKLIIHRDENVGCYWDVFQNGNSFEFTLNSNTALNGWKIDIFNNDVISTKTNFGATFSFEQGSKYKYYKIKSIETEKYLHIDLNQKRDDASYYITLVSDKNISTDFLLKISY